MADEYVFTAHDVHDNDDPNPDDENPPRHEHVTDPDSDPLKLGQALQEKLGQAHAQARAPRAGQAAERGLDGQAD